MNRIDNLSQKETIVLETILELRKKGIKPSFDLTKRILEELIYKDNQGNNLTNYRFVQKSATNLFGNNTIQFNPKYNSLNIVSDKMLLLIEIQCKSFLENTNVSEKEYQDLYYYLYFWSIMHEISHSKQYLIAFKNFDTEFSELRILYKELLVLLISDDNLLIPFGKMVRFAREIIYKIKQNELLLERNAHVESFESLVRMANNDYNLSPKIYNLLNEFYTLFLLSGYKKEESRIISPCEHSLKTVLKSRKLKKIEFFKEGTILDRLTLGLPISDDELAKIKAIKKEFSDRPVELKNEIYTLSKKLNYKYE